MLLNGWNLVHLTEERMVKHTGWCQFGGDHYSICSRGWISLYKLTEFTWFHQLPWTDLKLYANKRTNQQSSDTHNMRYLGMFSSCQQWWCCCDLNSLRMFSSSSSNSIVRLTWHQPLIMTSHSHDCVILLPPITRLIECRHQLLHSVLHPMLLLRNFQGYLRASSLINSIRSRFGELNLQ